jgi:hypothetical protein
MAIKGSQKPCPGCGEIRSNRRASEVCRHCKEDLAYARRVRQDLAAAGETIIVSFGDRDYANEYIYTRDTESGHRLRRLMFELAKSVSVPANVYHADVKNLLGEDDGASMRVYASMKTETARVIPILYKAIQEALRSEYEAGKADGHSLLMQLASGDLSISDFDDKVLKKK